MNDSGIDQTVLVPNHLLDLPAVNIFDHGRSDHSMSASALTRSVVSGRPCFSLGSGGEIIIGRKGFGGRRKQKSGLLCPPNVYLEDQKTAYFRSTYGE